MCQNFKPASQPVAQSEEHLPAKEVVKAEISASLKLGISHAKLVTKLIEAKKAAEGGIWETRLQWDKA